MCFLIGIYKYCTKVSKKNKVTNYSDENVTIFVKMTSILRNRLLYFVLLCHEWFDKRMTQCQLTD